MDNASYEFERALRHYTPLTVCRACGLLHGAVQCRRCAAMSSAVIRPFTPHHKRIGDHRA